MVTVKVVVRRSDHRASPLLRYFYGPDAEVDARTYAEKASAREETISAAVVPLPHRPRSERPHWRTPPW